MQWEKRRKSLSRLVLRRQHGVYHITMAVYSVPAHGTDMDIICRTKTRSSAGMISVTGEK